MLRNKKDKTGPFLALVCVAVLLGLMVVLENTLDPTSNILLFTSLKKGAVYALVAVSMNLLNGFTGLFSLGQAGFMLLGAYTYAILTIPVADREGVYYLYGGSVVNFSLPDLLGGADTPLGLVVGAFIIGISETVIKGSDWSVFSDAFTFALLIFILVVKPTGLFGEKATDKV